MRRPAPLPPELADGGAFGIDDALRFGLTRGRLSAGDLSTPFRGSRMVVGTDRSLRHLVLAYAARMPERQFFSHATAALLNGVPLPAAIERDPRLDVSVLEGAPRPRVRGVVGHVLEPTRTTVLASGRPRMTDAATTWCQLGTRLGVDDLVAAGDFMITGRGPVGGRAPMVRLADLESAVERHRGSSGVARLRIALPLIRYGPLSRRETRLRLAIMRAGLPEPAINHVVRDPLLGGWEPMIDLAYPRQRVGIEYEGDHHRDPRQFSADIRRYERLQDVGWSFVRVTAADLPEHGGDAESVALTMRIAARLEARGRRTD